MRNLIIKHNCCKTIDIHLSMIDFFLASKRLFHELYYGSVKVQVYKKKHRVV